MISLAIAYNKPKTYDLLQRPSREVHDQLRFAVRLGDLARTVRQISHLMEKSTVDYIKRHFDYEWKVPLRVDFEAGARAGVMIEGGDFDNFQNLTPRDFAAAWRKKNDQIEKKVHEELAE